MVSKYRNVFGNADKLARLYAREHFQYSSLEVHESLDSKGVPVKRLDGYLMHLTNDDLHHFLLKNIRYSHDWATEKYNNGKQVNLLMVVLRSIFSFIRECILFVGIYLVGRMVCFLQLHHWVIL